MPRKQIKRRASFLLIVCRILERILPERALGGWLRKKQKGRKNNVRHRGSLQYEPSAKVTLPEQFSHIYFPKAF